MSLTTMIAHAMLWFLASDGGADWPSRAPYASIGTPVETFDEPEASADDDDTDERQNKPALDFL